MKFVDLFAGLGGFHLALRKFGHECVFASEKDEELRQLYIKNFPDAVNIIHGDIREFRDKVPAHDILCAGFPCQPFSKSGTQQGLLDETRGTLFHEIIYILEKLGDKRPQYLILENVGNFERHDDGRTWQVVRHSLQKLGYDVRGTEHIRSGGSGLLSPHYLGFPHTRERFFIVASLRTLPEKPFPLFNRTLVTTLNDIVQPANELSANDLAETCLSTSQQNCINHWNELLSKLPENDVDLPSFPIWGDELDATYPFESYTPYAAPIEELIECLPVASASDRITKEGLLNLLPSYARSSIQNFPKWKIRFIRQNRKWFKEYRRFFSEEWVKRLRSFPSSLRKLEWNCQGEERNLWRHVLQFRPSGLRVKRYTTSPSLVAMTTTQIPILGPEKRFLTRVEGLRLQGFPDTHLLSNSRERAFKSLGNAVHVDVVTAIAQHTLSETTTSYTPVGDNQYLQHGPDLSIQGECKAGCETV